jgi:hypothetical protein
VGVYTRTTGIVLCGALVATGCFRGRGGKKVCTDSPVAIVHNNTSIPADVFWRTSLAGAETWLATAGPGITRYEIPIEPSVPVFLSVAPVPTVRRGVPRQISSRDVWAELSCVPARVPR